MSRTEQQFYETLRAEMKHQDKMRYADPDVGRDPDFGDGIHPHVVYVWRGGQWRLMGFIRRKPTAIRMRKWRNKFKAQDHETMHYVSLWDCQRNGPPVKPPPELSRTRSRKHVSVPMKPKRIRTDGLGRCSYATCTHRAPWLVRYTNRVTKARRVIPRCATHAWLDRFLPRNAIRVVCVQRPTKKSHSTHS